MRSNNNDNIEQIYAYDGNLALTKENWKCANCQRFVDVNTTCSEYNGEKVLPNKQFELEDLCKNYVSEETVSFMKEKYNVIIDIETPNIIKAIYKTPEQSFTGSVELKPEWDESMTMIAIQKATEEVLSRVADIINSSEEQIQDIPDVQVDSEVETVSKESVSNLINKLTTLLNDNNIAVETNSEVEKMLEGETQISWFERVTSWTRVLNAARRTIGRKQLNKEPSDSWKAKILLAEHSPIRLLEFDFGWEKIRQWVTAHLVRHHEGCEKFVHSQRGDRRELPCDRDHIYQGAKNDMDMTVNAQALISISRKRCCMCASKETREAWAQVLNKLKETDPILAGKCVRECVYRGFCPEWMSNCNYCYSPAYWLEVKNYRNTTFGDDEVWYLSEKYNCEISNIAHVRNHNKIIIQEHADKNGVYVDLYGDGNKTYVRNIVDSVFNTEGKIYKDGNKYNNATSNLV